MNEGGFAAYAFVGLGANLPSAQGDPVATLQQAVEALKALSASPLLVSPFYESDPKDCPPGSPRYVNAVVGLLPSSSETPLTLLHKLQAMENAHGRLRSGIRNEARTLDLDLLVFSDATNATAELMLPHPRAHERRFVLQPWQDVAGAGYALQGRPLSYWLAANQDPPLRRAVTT